MTSFPDDIFTEPRDVDPDTLANLGPLTRLAGAWEGRKGIDLNPKADGSGLVVRATRGDTAFGIASTPFLEHAFRTDSYELTVTFNPDGTWSYVSDTMLAVRGQAELFRHRDRNTLSKVAEPTPNPLALISRA